jgi:excisionase family DNA binding protein
MNLPETETFSSASSAAAAPLPCIGSTSNASSGHPGEGINSASVVSAASSHGSVLAFGAASDASHPGAATVACAASLDASGAGSGASAAASFSGSAAASEGGWLTPEQMAQKLNVSRRCLGNWARDRIIPMIKIGRVCRFDPPQVMAALKHHEQGVAKR